MVALSSNDLDGKLELTNVNSDFSIIESKKNKKFSEFELECWESVLWSNQIKRLVTH